VVASPPGNPGSMEIAEAQRQFTGAAGYLNSATIGLPPAGTVIAMRTAMERWQAGGGACARVRHTDS